VVAELPIWTLFTIQLIGNGNLSIQTVPSLYYVIIVLTLTDVMMGSLCTHTPNYLLKWYRTCDAYWHYPYSIGW